MAQWCDDLNVIRDKPLTYLAEQKVAIFVRLAPLTVDLNIYNF